MFRSKDRLPSRSSLRRALRMESLENRQLLVGEVLQFDFQIQDTAGNVIADQKVGLGQEFDLVVKAKDLRSSPEGIFSVNQSVLISAPTLVQLQYGETQRIDFDWGLAENFQLQFGSELTNLIPANPSDTAVENAVNAILGPDSVRVRRPTPESVEITYQNDWALQDVPPIRVEMLGGSATVIDNYDPGLVTSEGNHTTFAIFNEKFDAVNSLDGRISDDALYNVSAVHDFASDFPQATGTFLEIYRLRFEAMALGTVLFGGTPGDSQQQVNLLYGINNAIPNNLVLFDGISVEIVSQFDVNNDTFSILEDSLEVQLNVLANDISAFPMEIVAASTNGSGSVSITASGQGLRYSPAVNVSGVELIEYTVASNGQFQTGTVTINILPVNDPPVASDLFLNLSEDSSINFNPMESVTPGAGEDDQLLTAMIETMPSFGMVQTFANSMRYTPFANFAGNDSMVIRYTDNGSPSQSVFQTIHFQVNAVNDPPVATDRSFDLMEDSSVTFNARESVTPGPGEEDQLLTATVVTPPAFGTYVDSGTSMQYTPMANFSGMDSMVIRYTDNGSPSLSTLQTIFFQVTPVNDPPVATDLFLELNEDSSVTFNPRELVNPGPGEEDQLLSSIIVSAPVFGTISSVPSAMRYTPFANFAGTDSMVIRYSDNGSPQQTALQTIHFQVKPVNDPPTLESIPNVEMDEDTERQVNLNGISAGAGELGQLLKGTVTSSNPALLPIPVLDFNVESGTGTLLLKPKADQSGVAIVTVTFEDAGLDNVMTTAGDNAKTVRSFTVTVRAVNDAPVMSSLPMQTMREDGGLKTVSFRGFNAGGGENQPLRFTVGNPANPIISKPTVQYVPGETSATLRFESLANAHGETQFMLTIEDGGLDGSLATLSDNGKTTQPVTVVVQPVNDAPMLAEIPAQSMLEDASSKTVRLTGISPGPNETQLVRLSATSQNTRILNHPQVFYSDGLSTANLVMSPVPNAFGTVLVNVVVEDAGLDGLFTTSGDNLKTTRVMTVTINPVNDAPTITPFESLTILEDAPIFTVPLRGISAGPGENQPLRVSTIPVSSSGLASIIYTSPGSTGSLRIAPLPNANGRVTVVLQVTDGGLDGNLETATDNASTKTTLTIDITPVNDAPTMNSIANVTAFEDSAARTVTLTGITPGGNERQSMRVTAVSNRPELIPNPSVTFNPTSASAALRFTPVANMFGSAVMVVTAEDGGLDNSLATVADNLKVMRTFTVTVEPINDAPTFAGLTSFTVLEDALPGTVSLRNISPGPNEIQPIRFTAVSNNPTVVPNPTFTYAAGASVGTLNWKTLANASGVAVIVVTLEDGGNDRSLGTTADNRSIQQTFTITVKPVNDAPTIAPVADRTVRNTVGLQQVRLTGISAGGNESQPLRITVRSSNSSLIPTPTVVYASPSSTGSLNFTPSSTRTGTSTITVTVEDGGLDGNLATTGDNVRTLEVFVITVI